MNLGSKGGPNLLDPGLLIVVLIPKIVILLAGTLVKKYFLKAVRRKMYFKECSIGIDNFCRIWKHKRHLKKKIS